MKNTYEIKIYSIGASSEEHGPAIEKNIDDIFAKRIAIEVSEKIKADYVGHLPYSSDKTGDIARAWNNNYMDMKTMTKAIIKQIKYDIKTRKEIKREKFSHIIIISGHGGNNFLKKEERLISKALKIPTIYIPPLNGLSVKHPKYGKIISAHANDCEHSIALFLGLLNKKKFKEMNRLIKKGPINALRRWPVLVSLGGYVLEEIGGEKYKVLRDSRRKNILRNFLSSKRIIADMNVGKKFVENNIIMAENIVKKFTKKSHNF